MVRGKLVERVSRTGAGGGNFPPGLYSAELARASRYIGYAVPYASPSQKKVLLDLIRYYQTGSPADWRQFNIDWVRDNSSIDFTNGFIEVYKDPRGMRSEEHTSELQSLAYLVCRLLLEKKKTG